MLSWARPSLVRCPVRWDTGVIWSLSPEICDLKDLLTADSRRRYRKGNSEDYLRNTYNLKMRFWAWIHFHSSCPWCSFISSRFQSLPAFSGFSNWNDKYVFEMYQFMCCAQFFQKRKGCLDTMLLNEIPVDPICIWQGAAAILLRNS